jgi:cold-inducible RNA-binding protein
MPSYFVQNFRFDATELDLIDAFSQYGDVTKATIIRDRDTGNSKGYAFLEIDPDNGVDVVAETNGMRLGNRNINVELARPKSNNNPHRDGGRGKGKGRERQKRYDD